MPISANAAARAFCTASTWKIGDLQLHRLIYLAQVYHTGRSDGGLFVVDRFFSTDRGPLVPSLFALTRNFGAKPLRDVFGPNERLSKDERNLVDEIWSRFGHHDMDSLIKLTQPTNGAFRKRHTPNRMNAISDRDIYEDYLANFMNVDDKLEHIAA